MTGLYIIPTSTVSSYQTVFLLDTNQHILRILNQEGSGEGSGEVILDLLGSGDN
jgi:hypothetical protein